MASEQTKKDAFEWLVRKSCDTARQLGNHVNEEKIRSHCATIAETVNKKRDSGELTKRRKK